jgi:molybdate transport system substrate-binding protein
VKRLLLALTAVLLVAATGGCGSSGSSSAQSTNRTLTVYAAASLKGTFSQLGATFEAAHPGTTVAFNFAGSADLVTQLQGGAPADVFASAETTNMAKATTDRLVAGQPMTFASNTLAIAVPANNPAAITTFADLANHNVKLVICSVEVPCGSAAQKVATATGVKLEPVSEESSVTDVLNKVETGEADAGLVYVTDVKAAGDKVKGIPFAESKKAVNEYPIAQLAASKNKDLGKAFVDLVTGPDGQKVLRDAGFARP